MMFNDIELKPCPFCGSIKADVRNIMNGIIFVTCMDCDSCGPDGINEMQAVLKWNMRHEP